MSAKVGTAIADYNRLLTSAPCCLCRSFGSYDGMVKFTSHDGVLRGYAHAECAAERHVRPVWRQEPS